MPEVIVVDVAITPEELSGWYRGHALTVLARAHDGRWIRFPAAALRAAVTRLGVHGRFALTVEAGRLIRCERVTPSRA